MSEEAKVSEAALALTENSSEPCVVVSRSPSQRKENELSPFVEAALSFGWGGRASVLTKYGEPPYAPV